MIIFLLVALGLIFGSFINAWVWRTSLQFTKNTNSKKYKKQKADILHGRSMCPACQHELSWADLIPVFSWVSLRGKCRYCQKPISIQYPIVELLTAVAFVVSFMAWPLALSNSAEFVYFALWLCALVTFIALVIHDFKHMILPNTMILPSFIVSLIAVGVSLHQNGWVLSSVYATLASSIVFGGFFYILFQASGGRWIGGGDVKLACVLGLWLPSVLFIPVVLFVSSVLGLVFVFLFGLRSGRLDLKAKIPYGPMLIFALIAIFFAQEAVAASFADVFYIYI